MLSQQNLIIIQNWKALNHDVGKKSVPAHSERFLLRKFVSFPFEDAYVCSESICVNIYCFSCGFYQISARENGT